MRPPAGSRCPGQSERVALRRDWRELPRRRCRPDFVESGMVAPMRQGAQEMVGLASRRLSMGRARRSELASSRTNGLYAVPDPMACRCAPTGIEATLRQCERSPRARAAIEVRARVDHAAVERRTSWPSCPSWCHRTRGAGDARRCSWRTLRQRLGPGSRRTVRLRTPDSTRRFRCHRRSRPPRSGPASAAVRRRRSGLTSRVQRPRSPALPPVPPLDVPLSRKRRSRRSVAAGDRREQEDGPRAVIRTCRGMRSRSGRGRSGNACGRARPQVSGARSGRGRRT